MARAYMPARILLSAVELGLFEELAAEPRTSEEVATRRGLDSNVVEILLDTLTSLKLVEKDGNRYRLPAEYRPVLGGGDGDGGLGHLAALWKRWSHLSDIARGHRPPDPDWATEMVADLASSMQHQALDLADRIARIVDCRGVVRALDLGSGPGAYATAFAERYPQTRWVCVDHSPVMIELATREIESRGLRDRVEAVVADFMREDVGNAFDLVFLSAVLCVSSADENRRLLRRIHEALRPGGRLVVHDHLLDPSRTSPAAAALLSVNMLVNTPGGRAYSAAEVKDWLRDLGFTKTHALPLGATSLLVATRGDALEQTPEPPAAPARATRAPGGAPK